MKNNSNPLDTRYFLPDERTLSDFLKFINSLSKEVKFFDDNLNPKGDWSKFFISDELFLLAEIESFDIQSAEKEKRETLLSFEKSDNDQEKGILIICIFDQIKFMLKTIDNWYLLSSKYNKQRESSALEIELVAAITYRCKQVYFQISLLSRELQELGSPLFLNVDDLDLNQLWISQDEALNQPGAGWGAEILEPNYVLKQLLLLHRPVLKTIANLIERSNQLIKVNLSQKSDHEPHVGLLLTFFELFKKLQDEINTVPDRLMSYYFEEILGQHKQGQISDTIHCYVNVDPEVEEIIIPKDVKVLAGQNQYGQDIKYQLEDSVRVANIELGNLYTLFISRNKLIDPGTAFQIVNGIYSKNIDPKKRLEPFLALGEEQRFLSEELKTMKEVEIGFSISSPTLRLQGGYRTVKIDFIFEKESYQYFLAMLLSVSNTRNQLPEEIFHQIFLGSLIIKYSAPTGWVYIKNYEVIPPLDWNQNGFQIAFTLGPSSPSMSPYTEEVHQDNLHIKQPVLKVLLQNQHVFHPYSFLQFLELEQIKISADVRQLKTLNLFSSYGALDQSIPFDLFGPTPKVGSYLLLGNDEIFSKDLDNLKIGWTYHGLPMGGNMKSYFKGYPYAVTNESFKVKIQALSDFRFMPKDQRHTISVNLFEEIDENVSDKRLIQLIDLSRLEIIPQYDFSFEQGNDFSINQKTGFLKLELISPAIGFGFDVYTDVYNKSINMSANKQIEKPSSGFSFEAPQEPFSPMAKDVFIDYSSSSEINFSGSRAFVNISDKQENFIQIHPFGKKFLVKDGLVFDKGLLPFLELQGALFLGFEAKKFPEELSILFKIGKNENWFHGEAPKLDWFYLANDIWKPFKIEDVLLDGTYGLTRSGIISFKDPKDITQGNIVMPKECYWICCRTKDNSDIASLITGVYLNAFSAKAILEEDKAHDPVLPAFQVQSFEPQVSGVLDLIQPIASEGGRAQESKLSFYKRVSDSLKHKFRAVTKWDIESMLLQEFDWLGFVKVFGNFGFENFVDLGSIVVVGVPKIVDTQRFYLPKMNPGQIKQVEVYLRKILNPFATFKVINPQYEYLLIKGKIKFNSLDTGLLFKRLYQELLEKTCPWFYQDLAQVFAYRDAKSSEILNLISDRSYVKFFTSFSLAHMYQNESGDFSFVDSALVEDSMEKVSIGRPWSILIPYPLKRIELIEDEKYIAPQPFDFEDLVLGENLIITSANIDSNPEPSPPIEETEDEAIYHFNFNI